MTSLFIFLDMDSGEDSQVDIFATQPPTKKRKEKEITSSAPVLHTKKPNDYVYKWLIIFRWGDDTDGPFEMVALDDLNPSEYEANWLTGIMSPKSRRKYRNLDIYPDFSVSVFAKVESGIPFFSFLFTLYI